MNLKGKKVKIVVSEPWDWDDVLFGTILSDNSDTELLIKVTKPVTGKKLTSDLMELSVRYEKTTFRQLSKSQSVTVGGALVTENSDEFDYIIIGSVTLN